jgi:formate dehydrogenase major subunit
LDAIRLKIDDREVTGFKGQTILDIARANKIDIPTLCHDDRVEMYGSCGLCVVEAEGIPKLLRSCSTMAADGMIIRTNSQRISQNRQAALELLLSDHTGDCRPPCTLACPAQTDCQGYVGLIANGAYNEAYVLIKDKIPLPASIGRVCPHPCEEACRRKLVDEPISIAALKQFAADAQHTRGELYNAEIQASTGKSVAIIGGGPGGLSAAYFLRSQGHDVTVYDAMPYMGGMLRYGIPEYRLPKKVLQEEIDAIEEMGVHFYNNVRIGGDITLDSLKKDFDAVVIAIGAWSNTGLGCPGEKLDGVHGGIEFLWNISGITPKLLRRRVAIVGGGNTAMDACRTAVRSGASVVYNIYRRTRNEMPAEESEIVEAEEEGVIFKNLTNPIEILGENGKVKSILLQIMELGEPDASGRRRPVPVPGREETIDVDIVIVAIGQKPDTLGFQDINQSKWSTIIADEHTFRTNIEGVFAVGDATNNGADIAITAIGEAKSAAAMVNKYLCGESLKYEEPFLVKSIKTEADFAGKEKQARAKMPHRSANDRKKDFLEVNFGLSAEEAKREASRCLECGCMEFFKCKLVSYAGQYQVQPEKYSGKVHQRFHEDNHPYIRRNPDKCILCGLCVRMCEEVTGANSIGFMERGFDTVVKTAFNADLRDTDCISCGQCVNVCPTGALTEMMMVAKQVPLREKLTETVCAFCSIGCKIRLASNGSLLLRSRPSSEKGALLCMKGRLGPGKIGRAERIVVPLIRLESGMCETTFEQAIAVVNKSLKSLQTQFGNDCIAVAISDRYTNEEVFLIKEYAEKALKTNKVFSFGQTDSGLADVLGRDASTATLDELENTDLIVVVAPEPEMQSSVAAMKIRRAVSKGAKLLLLPSKLDLKVNLLDDMATLRLDMGGELASMEQIIKVLLDSGYGEGMKGLDELRASLTGITVNKEVRAAADIIMKAKKAVFIFAKNAITTQAARLVADIAVLSGHAGNPNGGIVQLLPGANSQGLINLGIGSGEDYFRKVAEGGIRGLFIFGEEIDGLHLGPIDFLAVQDLHMTDVARQANVVLPASSFAEIDGSFTASDNETRELKPAVASPVAWDNIKALAAQAGVTMPYQSVADIRVAMNHFGTPDSHGVRLAAIKKGALCRLNNSATNEQDT